MLRHICQAIACAAFLTLTAGCVEQTAVVTLNPNGQGKIQYDILTQGEYDPDFFFMPDQKGKSLEEKLHSKVARLLAMQGVTAWADVSARWSPDGRFHFKGTAYFDRLDEIWGKQKNETTFEDKFDIAIDKDKGLRLTLRERN